ncbi:MAG: DsbA family protein [Patescibacteria group bacterium]
MEEQNAKTEEASTAAKVNYMQLLLPGSILLAAILISGTLIFTRGQGGGGAAQIGNVPQAQNEPIDIKVNQNDHILGNKNAKVTIVEYSDFECPFCKKFWSETLPLIKKEFIESGKAHFVYRHFPLPSHSGAKPAALATECAAEQGKFWQMHDEIYKRQDGQGQSAQLTKDNLKKWAVAIGLDTAKFNQCLDSEKYSKKINDDLASGQTVGVTGTPTVFINGQKIVGAQPYETFKQAIDALLK